MSSRKLTLSLCCVTIVAFSPAYAAYDDEMHILDTSPATNEWRLVKDDQRHQIKTYSKQEDNKRYRSFRVDAAYNASLDAVARQQLDIGNMKRWYMNAEESVLLKRVSETEGFYYLKMKTPFGVPGRDMVVHFEIEPYSAKRGALMIRYNAAPEYIPAKSGIVRIPMYEMTVRMTPLASGHTREEIEGYAESGGTAPVWLVNYFQRMMPYTNMVGKIRGVERYKDSVEPFPFKYRE